MDNENIYILKKSNLYMLYQQRGMSWPLDIKSSNRLCVPLMIT